jgi:hypothetical protein
MKQETNPSSTFGEVISRTFYMSKRLGKSGKSGLIDCIYTHHLRGMNTTYRYL